MLCNVVLIIVLLVTTSCLPFMHTHPCLTADFMKSIQEDAKERAERRKEREKAGKELKKKGTRAFRSSDYNSAIEFYSKAIQEMPWDITLYTNRALVRCRHKN